MDVREKLVELLERAFESFIDDPFCIPDEREFADHLIANGVTVQEWISVKDRLPEQGQEVIAYSGNILSPSVFAYKFWRKDYDTWVHVTHWMPMPDAPKGE